MKLPKDFLSQAYTKPRIFLCEVDKERICQLETTNTQGTLKFNSYSELSFEVGRFYNDIITGRTEVNPYFDKIEALRLIELEGFGYFEIQGPEITGDGIKEVKSVTAYSLEYTLSQKYLEDFYVKTGGINSVEAIYAKNKYGDKWKEYPLPVATLYNPAEPEISILHLALGKAYGWSIGYVDDSLKTLGRTFEIDRCSIYDFLVNEVSEKFNCYIVFDTKDNTINVYAESLTAKFIGDGKTNTFTVNPPFAEVNTVSVNSYKTTRWEYNSTTGALKLDDIPESGAFIEIVDKGLTKWKTDVFVTFENLSQEINVSYDADAIKTKLTVTYGDDYDIREANLGMPYLVDISYYYSVDWMGQGLYKAYTEYMQKSNSLQSEYTNNSQEILKWNDKIYYEEHRLSLNYAKATVDSNTVGTYYVRQENSDGIYYYKEVSLPGEWKADTDYYSNLTVNVEDGAEGNVAKLYAALKKYFNNENESKEEGDTTITSWKTDIEKLEDSFSFVEKKDSNGKVILNFSSFVTTLNGVTKNRIDNNTVKNAIKNFLLEVWKELGRTPLNELHLKYYQEKKDANVEAGWNNKSSENYPYYYPVLLFIDSINTAIKERDKTIEGYTNEKKKIENANSDIAKQLDMKQNFDDEQLVKLNAFFREDELHIDDIVETSQDDLSSSFKIKQDAMESGRIELQKISQPQLQFQMTMANIYALPEFEPIIDQFQLGNVIRVGLRPDYVKQSRLLQVNINFDDFSDFSCEFGELTSLRTQSDIHADLLKNAITAGKSVATNSGRWTRGSDTASAISLKIQQGLLDATTQIKSIDGTQGTYIDKYGIHLIKTDPDTGEVDPKQGWIVNNQFLYSSDGFETTESVFGEFKYGGQTYYGILAEALVGNLIVGTQLKIEGDGTALDIKANSSITGLSSQITQTAGEIRSEVSNSITGLSSQITQNTNSISTKVSKGNIISEINQSAEQVSISANKIKLEGITTVNDYFKINNDGSMEATCGKIGGWTIGEKTISADSSKYRVRLSCYKNDDEKSRILHCNDISAENDDPKKYNSVDNDTFAILRDGTVKIGKPSGQLRLAEGKIKFFYNDEEKGIIDLLASPSAIQISKADLYCNKDIYVRGEVYSGKNIYFDGYGQHLYWNQIQMVGVTDKNNFKLGDANQPGGTYIHSSTGIIMRPDKSTDNIATFVLNGLEFQNGKGILLNQALAFRYYDKSVCVGASGENLTFYAKSISFNSVPIASNFCFNNNKHIYWNNGTGNIETIGLSDKNNLRLGNSDQGGYTVLYSSDYIGFRPDKSTDNIAKFTTEGLRFKDDTGILLDQKDQKYAFRYYEGAVYTGIDTKPLKLVGSSVTSNGATVTSDSRLKKGIVELDSKYRDLLNVLSAKNYQFNKYRPDVTNCGFIAQELLESMSEVGLSPNDFGAFVDVYGDGREYAIDYTQFIPIMWEEIKTLRNKISQLENNKQKGN